MFGQQLQRRNMTDSYADGNAAFIANMPAQDARGMLPSMMGQMSNGGFLDPNGQYQQALEQRSTRQQVQNANMDNRQTNEALKRRYVLDTYSNAQNMGMKAIDAYLAGNNQSMAGRQNLAMAFAR